MTLDNIPRSTYVGGHDISTTQNKQPVKVLPIVATATRSIARSIAGHRREH